MAKKVKKCENCQCWVRDPYNHYQGACSYLTNQAQYVVKDAKIFSIAKVITDPQGVCKNHVNN